MGIYAMVLFKHLGGAIEVILRENYRSVIAGQQMKETLERMDSGAFFTLVGEDQRGREMYEQNRPLFGDALKLELNNITLPGERELADSLQSLFNSYTSQIQKFLEMPDLRAKRETYFSSLLPLATKIKDTAQEIIRINQENMLQAERDARSLSDRSTRYLFLAVLIGILACLYFANRLQRSILRPIETLTAVSKELGEGNLDQVVPVQSRDELGQLAEAFNKMASKLRAYRQVTTDQVLQARQMTEITLSAFPDPVLSYSIAAEVNFVNPAAERLLNKLGLKNRLPDEVFSEVDRVLKGGPDYLPTSFEKAILLRVDDDELFLLPRVIGMRDENGNLFGAAVVLQDVTRFRLMDEVKTNLVSTVSHELKTPLTSIRMGLHLLLEERIGSLTPKQMELLLAAREDSERLLQMINDLLDLARLESGKTRKVLERIYPKTLVNSAFEDLTPLAESFGCHLVAKAAPGLPLVAVDAGQIHHVFANLVSNAAKHSKPGDEVLIEAKPGTSGVLFSVIDHGPGIPLEYQSNIFDRFFRIPGTEKNGVGLGLAIVKEIVASHGGRVGLRSVPGQGSEFYFELPIAEGINV
jgi:signal transduction histidine kinase